MLLGQMKTDEVKARLAGGRVVVLLPVGSVEPHGPHLPLETDTIISMKAAEHGVVRLGSVGVAAVIAPPVAYGVTDFAEGFAGAVSVPAEALTAWLRAVVKGYLKAGFAHVCLVNNHLEPAQDAAVRAAIDGEGVGRASVACPLARRWAKTLSDEFKSGACHAGRYETSLVLAADAERVDEAAQRALPPLTLSLSDGIKAGVSRFSDLGMERAYTGAPAEATAEEGRDLYERLGEMVATVTLEAIALLEDAR